MSRDIKYMQKHQCFIDARINQQHYHDREIQPSPLFLMNCIKWSLMFWIQMHFYTFNNRVLLFSLNCYCLIFLNHIIFYSEWSLLDATSHFSFMLVIYYLFLNLLYIHLCMLCSINGSPKGMKYIYTFNSSSDFCMFSPCAVALWIV
jgi:hypothetical protein